MLLSVLNTVVAFAIAIMALLLIVAYFFPIKMPETAYWVLAKKDANAYIGLVIVLLTGVVIAAFNALVLTAFLLAGLAVLLELFHYLPTTTMAEFKRIELGMMRLRRNAGLMGIFTASDDNL